MYSEELLKGEIQSLKKNQAIQFGLPFQKACRKRYGLDVGDSLVFDMQGVPIKTFISGIRKVEWPKDPPNFIFVFPKGVLEAPRKSGLQLRG
jgi:putative ABC transport system permease protein